MGGAESKHLELLPVPKDESFIIYCYATGKLELVNAPDAAVKIISDTVHEEWAPNCRLMRRTANVHKLKFGSSPFYTFSAESSIKARRLFCHINANLAKQSWALVNAPVLVHRFGLSSWIYMKTSAATDSGNEYCAISLSSGSNLQFIDFPPGLAQKLSDHITSIYRDTMDNFEEVCPGQFSVSLHGGLWFTTGKDSFRARKLLLDVINFMDSHGFKLIISTALKEETCDCMYFRRMHTKDAENLYPEVPTDVDTMPPPQQQENYMMMAMKSNDYIVIIKASNHLINEMRASFEKHWSSGLKNFTEKHGYPVIGFHGSPWSLYGEGEIEVKNMLTLFLQDLAMLGYHPVESIDCSRRIEDKSTIVFVNVPPVRMHYICIALSHHAGRIHIINAETEVLSIIRQEFLKYYTPGISKEGPYGCSWRIRFNYSPISGGDTKATLCFQAALLACLCELQTLGYSIMCSLDTTNHYISHNSSEHKEALSAHSLFLARCVS